MLEPREFKAPFIKIENIRTAADEFRAKYWPQDSIPLDIFEIREYIAHGIAPYFEVSEQVIEKRLIKENLWPPTQRRNCQ